MRRSKTEIYLHFVWATAKRQPFLRPEVERAVHRCIRLEVEKMKCVVLACDGMPDHVHLVVQLHPTATPARLAQAVKGTSSTLARNRFAFEEPFDWQDNYAAFSISRSQLNRVISYVKNQKRHHATGETCDEWEQTDEEAELAEPKK